MRKIDDILATGRRGLRSRPGTHLLGPTGARLWADYLEDVPGFVGCMDYIHKSNIPQLFSVTTDVAAPPVPSQVEWRPSHLSTWHKLGDLSLEERRFITWDDEAVSIQTWRNDGDSERTLRLTVDPEWMRIANGTASGEREVPAHDFALRMVVSTSEPRAFEGLVLAPGASVTIVVAAAVGLADEESFDGLFARVSRHLDQTPTALLSTQIDAYQAWFDAVPQFTSSSEMLDRVYAYRWYILRRTLAAPNRGAFAAPFFYEGRGHKMTKTPWAPVGWEFSKLIPLSTPMHIIEARWHSDQSLATNVLSVLKEAQAEDGQFNARTLTKTMHPYANFTGWAVWQQVMLRGMSDAVAEALPMLKRQVDGEDSYLATSGDGLPVQQRHQLTGKEYQPSYWYFHDYADDPLDPATYTPLKRVDRAIYQYLKARGVAALCREVGDNDAERFEQLADRIADSVLTKQWDPQTAFFYDLHHETDAKAMVRNVVGLYPYWAGLTDQSHLPGLFEALGPEHFDTPMPLPSVSPECPVFQPGGGWKGQFLKGRNGCMWNGPTWPYTNSIALDAIATAARTTDRALDHRFAHFFWKYVQLHFTQQDGARPYLVEHYDSMTGEPISDEPDYNHSYLIDLILRHVVGLQIDGAGGIAVDPIDIGLDWFRVTNVGIGDERYDISFDTVTGVSMVRT